MLIPISFFIFITIIIIAIDSHDDACFEDFIARMFAFQQQNLKELHNALATSTLRIGQVSQENLILYDTISCLERILETKIGNSSSFSKKLELSMPEKFDETRSKFCGFANQVRLFIRMQLHGFSTQIFKVGLVGILLLGSALSSYGPLNEQNSSMLEDFGAFMEEFLTTFEDNDKARMANNKIRDLSQDLSGNSIEDYKTM